MHRCWKHLLTGLVVEAAFGVVYGGIWLWQKIDVMKYGHACLVALVALCVTYIGGALLYELVTSGDDLVRPGDEGMGY